jgi:threonine aldolase
MRRRQFLAASGLAAATPALGATAGAASRPDVAAARTVNFFFDGLNRTPAEYAELLREDVSRDTFAPDNYSLGGAIETLEKTFAQRLGKQAAMFVASGTLANLLAVRKLAGADRRVLVQADSHLYCDSGDGASTLAGLNLVPLGHDRVFFTLDEVKREVERARGGRVEQRVGAISIESPVRRHDHAHVDLAELDRVCAYARENGIRLHLDGARLFNLPQHTGRSVRDYAAAFDTVFVSVWKHFDGVSGAILAGDAGLIDGLFHTRRMFGGALPQAWPLVAPVTRSLAGYENNYARAWRAMDEITALLHASKRFAVRTLDAGTCRVYLDVHGADPQQLVARARDHGVQLPNPRPDTGEFPLQVNLSLLRRPAAEIAQVLIAASG